MPSSDLLTHVSKKLITYLTEFAEFKDGIYCFVSIVSPSKGPKYEGAVKISL